MSQEIEYTKFETFGVWQESSEKPEEQVVVSFGKSTLLLKDINESIVAQWSFPSISVNTLPDGQVTFSPDEDGIEKLTISDEEMIEQLKKVIQAPIYDRKNFRTIFFLIISILVTLKKPFRRTLSSTRSTYQTKPLLSFRPASPV